MAAAIALTGCTKTESSELLSDPFVKTSSLTEDPDASLDTSDANEQSSSSEHNSESDFSSDTREEIRERVIALSNCGVRMTVNDDKLVYNDEPVKVSVTLETNRRNEINCSFGISVFINGLAQEVSADGADYSYMAVYKELEPDKKYETELYFKPSVLPEDKDKDSLEVSFVQCSNADYIPSRLYLTLFGTHEFDLLRKTIEMTVSKEITDIIEREIESEFTAEFVKKPTHDMSDFIPNNLKDNEYGLLYLSEDGSLSATYSLQNTAVGTHRLALFVNDKPATFNGGKSFCDIEVEPDTKYLLDIVLDENPDELGYIYMLDFYEEEVKNGVIYAHVDSPTPKIIVAHDFKR